MYEVVIVRIRHVVLKLSMRLRPLRCTLLAALFCHLRWPPLKAFSMRFTKTFQVGIRGHAPASIHDIYLGDVVVSQSYELSGGVIQYDRGKTRREISTYRVA